MKSLVTIFALVAISSSAFASEKINCTITDARAPSQTVSVDLSRTDADPQGNSTQTTGDASVRFNSGNGDNVSIEISHIQILRGDVSDYYHIEVQATGANGGNVAITSNSLKPISASFSDTSFSVQCSK